MSPATWTVCSTPTLSWGNDSPSDVTWDPARLGPTSVPCSTLTGLGGGGALGVVFFLVFFGAAAVGVVDCADDVGASDCVGNGENA